MNFMKLLVSSLLLMSATSVDAFVHRIGLGKPLIFAPFFESRINDVKIVMEVRVSDGLS